MFENSISTCMKKCAAFWNHANLRNGDRIFACCRFKTPVQMFDGDLKTVLFSKEYDKLRQTNVEDLTQCQKCMHEESKGKESLRQRFNKTYGMDKIELKYFEVGFDNICDLACDGCWEEWSHTWALKKSIPIKDAIRNTSEITSIPDTIEKIVFLGGEPLMTNRHQKFLQLFSRLKDISVEYNTNGMHTIDDKTHHLLSQCKDVKIIVSIDGYGQLNNKVRSNSDWNTVSNFALEAKKRYNLEIHTTIHKNNWHGLPDLKNWININQFTWTTNLLTFPEELDIKNLPKDKKNMLIGLLNDIPNSQYIKEHLF